MKTISVQFQSFLTLNSLVLMFVSGKDVCFHETQRERYQYVIKSIVTAKQDRLSIIALNQNISICGIDNDIITKPTFPNGEPQKWVKIPDRQVYVFSAFYDQRKLSHDQGIRIIACGLQEEFNVIGDLHCYLWYEDRSYAIVVKALYHRIYRSMAHADMWVSHFIICPLPYVTPRQRPVPYAVSVVATPCVQPIHSLMVLNRESVPKKRGHALCTSPLYGKFRNWTMVAEMFELQTLLGAGEITIYQHSAHWKTEKVLESYKEDPNMKVNVVMWNTFPPFKSSVFCQRGALNDCLYRMGHKYEYVSVTDLDEVLVPRMFPTWPKLMKHIAKPQYGAYLFQHAYHRRNYTEEIKHPLQLISQTSLWRTDVVIPPGKIRCKTMYRASQAISIDLHFPYLLVPGAEEYILDPAEGMLHHYRSYPMESFARHPDDYHFIEDRYMERYSTKLSQRMAARIADTRKRF